MFRTLKQKVARDCPHHVLMPSCTEAVCPITHFLVTRVYVKMKVSHMDKQFDKLTYLVLRGGLRKTRFQVTQFGNQ